MPKAQIAGEVFVYILLVVIVGIIFLLGYNYYNKLMVQKCSVEEVTFVTAIKDFTNRYNEFGTVEKRAISAPCTYTQVCFIDVGAIKTSASLTIPSAIIANSVKGGIKQNIFLVGKKTKPLGYAEKMKVDNAGFICINRTAGNFRVTFKGDGEYTHIETYNQATP